MTEPIIPGYAAEIAALRRQLAEAQEARDLNAAALECYSAEQARLRKELAEALANVDPLGDCPWKCKYSACYAHQLAEAQGVIERQREIIAVALSEHEANHGRFAPDYLPKHWTNQARAIFHALREEKPEHAAAYRTTGEPRE